MKTYQVIDERLQAYSVLSMEFTDNFATAFCQDFNIGFKLAKGVVSNPDYELKEVGKAGKNFVDENNIALKERPFLKAREGIELINTI